MLALKHYANDGATQISGKDWGRSQAGRGQVAEKFLVENVSDRVLESLLGELVQVGVNDGKSMFRWGLDPVTLSKPWGLGTAGALVATLSASGAGGVWGAPGIRGYRLTATNAVGETIGSTEVTINVDVATKKVTLTWIQTPNAAGYILYRTDTPGTYGASSLRAVMGSGATLTFVDDGSSTSTGTLPTANTTGGWKPTLVLSGAAAGGVWGGTGLVYYRVVALDGAGVCLAASLEASINVDDVTKKVTISWPAIVGTVTYKLYRSVVAGEYLAALRVSQAGTSYVDNGGALSAGDLTRPPSYGQAPVLGIADLVMGNVAVGQQVPYWCTRLIPANTSELGNKRLSVRRFRESAETVCP